MVASDAEIPAADGALGRALRAAGSSRSPRSSRRATGSASPCRRAPTMRRPRTGLSKSTRQRIDAAERDGIVVRRYDTAGWDGDHPLFDGPDARSTRSSATSRPCSRGPASAAASGSGRAACSSTGGGRPAAGLVVHLEARDDRRASWAACSCTAMATALDRPLGRRPGCPRQPPGRHAPAALAGDPAGHPRGPRRRWTSAASTSARTTANRARATRWPGCTSTSARSGRLGRDDRRARAGHPAVALRPRAGRRARGQARRSMTGDRPSSPAAGPGAPRADRGPDRRASRAEGGCAGRASTDGRPAAPRWPTSPSPA